MYSSLSCLPACTHGFTSPWPVKFPLYSRKNTGQGKHNSKMLFSFVFKQLCLPKLSMGSVYINKSWQPEHCLHARCPFAAHSLSLLLLSLQLGSQIGVLGQPLSLRFFLLCQITHSLLLPLNLSQTFVITTRTLILWYALVRSGSLVKRMDLKCIEQVRLQKRQILSKGIPPGNPL